jgi:hypothetical protein
MNIQNKVSDKILKIEELIKNKDYKIKELQNY